MTASLSTAKDSRSHLQQRYVRHLRKCRVPGRQILACETGFDDFARLAAHLANAPIAAIALANSAPLLLKSLIGLREQAADTLLSACGRAASSSMPTVIADMNEDAWFRQHPIENGESPLRFFAAIPLIDTSNKIAGSLVVMDAAPRTLLPEQLNALYTVSRQIVAHQELCNRHLKLRELAAHQENIKEQERKRIAQDLHDELGQNLMSLKLDLLRIQQTVYATPISGECGPQIQSAIHHLDGTICAVRHIINDLRPPVLELGLHAAIEWQLDKFRRSSELHCELQANHQQWQGLLDDAQTEILFRVLQESLTNIARHAKARRVRISLRSSECDLQMCIHDDGIGIDRLDLGKQASFGLSGMRERLHKLNGALHIASTPGQGTVLTINIPLQTFPKKDWQ